MRSAPPARPAAPPALLVGVLGVTLLVSAGLLFTLEPMVGKMLLPAVGGSPAVWTTCMLFFQAVLLAAYLYAHVASSRVGLSAQLALHLAVMAAPLLVLPVGGGAPAPAPPSGAAPVPWLLGRLLVTVGLPFFAVATTSPMLQRWLSQSIHPAARDPYFLYVASNLGSLGGLLAYPFLIERHLDLRQQGRAWAWAYAALIALTAVAAAAVWRARRRAEPDAAPTRSRPSPAPPAAAGAGAAGGAADAPSRWRWLALSLVPSSWLLGFTAYLTSDLAPAPLFWVVPLALYLLTFILAFASVGPRVHRLARHVLPVGVLAVLFLHAIAVLEPLWLAIPVHLITFFAGAMVCHGELAARRPPPERLTEYYLSMALGGALGGVLNALIVPALFAAAGPIEGAAAAAINRLELAEYPLAMIAACALGLHRRPGAPAAPAGASRRLALWLTLAVFALAGLVRLRVAGLHGDRGEVAYVFGLLALACFALVRRPRAFAAGLLAFVVATALGTGTPPLLVERSFFGVLRVSREGEHYQLRHGSTVHGLQGATPERRREPLSYYHPTGPVGQIVDAYRASRAVRSVGVVGLGIGSLASYAIPGEPWTFYEIDPAAVRIARDRRYFHYLDELEESGLLRVVVGDARVSLAGAPDASFGLLLLDAFSSDAVPVHLLTREALALYARKIDGAGLFAFHVSSRHLDLPGVLGDLAASHDPPLAAAVRHDTQRTGPKWQSTWVAVARSADGLGPIASDPRWQALPGRVGSRPWTDGFADVVGAM